MLSSAFFFFAAKWFFSLRSLQVLLESEPRYEQKQKLLKILQRLDSYSFVELSAKAVQTTDMIFNSLLSPRIWGMTYVTKAILIGFLVGVVSSYLAGLPLSKSLSEWLLLPASPTWRQMVIFPSVISGPVIFLVDITIAHLLCRWATKGRSSRALISLMAAILIAYVLLAVGTGLISFVGIFLMGSFFEPTFALNRIAVSFADPFSGSGNIARYGHYVSFSLLGVSGIISSLGSTIILFGANILRFFPSPIRTGVAAPLFWVLSVMRIFEKRGLNVRIGLFVWIGTPALVVIAILLKMQGF